MKKKTYYLVSLGCAKNTVDSESISSLLEKNGYRGVGKPEKAELLIVNTCGFISPARDEAIEVLQDLAENKLNNQLLIAAGCMTQRFPQVVIDRVPQIDGIIGTRRWMDILELVDNLRHRKTPKPMYHLPEAATVGQDEKNIPRIAVQGGSAYLKIADGCHRPCAFCSIPLIKGTTVSRPSEAILEEAILLSQVGIQELILIAQDTTAYGLDRGEKDGLPILLENLMRTVPNIPWIRMLYTFPGYVTDHLIDVMAQNSQILPYLDMPLQHAHPETLRRMRRPANMDWVYRTLEKMRTAIPGIALRTTFIVGYPGETEEEYQTLLDFVSEIQFDHVGVFPFYFEPGTTSEPLGDPIPLQVKEERLERLMLLQQDISQKRNQKFIGKTLPILIEGYNDGISIGRSYRDAPEIDGLVFAEGQAEIGTLVHAKITGAMPHDLMGHIVKSYEKNLKDGVS